jgi:1-deoxy-D-xylulose-5-phosphate reductoisomerase
MGKKISVDSATMMNKGLELIEACYLFAVESHRIDIVIHPQSIIHSMVSYEDGSVLAQLGRPDMRTPIAHCLAWPERMASGVQALDVFAMGSLTFESPDLNRFPALRLARQVSEQLGSMPCAMNAANEVAVTAFLRGEIAFTRIVEVVEEVLQRHNNQVVGSIEQLLAIDEQCRHMAMQLCRGK